jgi:hypothetical protein
MRRTEAVAVMTPRPTICSPRDQGPLLCLAKAIRQATLGGLGPSAWKSFQMMDSKENVPTTTFNN